MGRAFFVFLVLGASVGLEAQTPMAVNCDPDSPFDLTPSFTPFTTAPVIQNRDEVRAAIESTYPQVVRGAGVGGRVILWLYIDRRGIVQKAQVNRSSGHSPLDIAALRVGCVFMFRPALKDDQIVPVWLSMPVELRPEPLQEG